MVNVNEIIDLMKSPSKEDITLITKAFDFSQKAHDGQKRYSGEPYFNHVFETAKNLAEFNMRAISISAGLLHDTIEDTPVTKEEIKKEFGEEILFLIEGVTKLGTLKYRGLKRHTESLRKLFIATSQDIRVLIIKLADRIHNMETLEHVPKEKQLRIASETLEIFAPLAYRLGMRVLNRKLEDLAFQYVYPDDYKKIKDILKTKSKRDLQFLQKIDRSLKKKLAKKGITNFKTSYRTKGLYSLHKKLIRKDMDIDKIYDIAALRIIVPKTSDCYTVLGVIHEMWRPMPGRIKDYIAFPKPNGYKSIHTTIFTGNGGLIEIQIRTEKMHREAEYGVASHVLYKDDQSKNSLSRISPEWIKAFLSKDKISEEKAEAPDWMKKMVSNLDIRSDNFIKQFKKDFSEHRIFVFTPDGDVIDLPTDSSPIDFAYTIHSDIGNHISGAKIHGKLASLDTKLQNGDIVEIMTNKKNNPKKKWLDWVKTSEAERHIKNTLRKNRG
ncbi:RelA/SpoT family protein [Patescibacteria group bacterium]